MGRAFSSLRRRWCPKPGGEEGIVSGDPLVPFTVEDILTCPQFGVDGSPDMQSQRQQRAVLYMGDPGWIE